MSTNVLVEYEALAPTVALIRQVFSAFHEYYPECEFRYIRVSCITEKEFDWCDIIISVRGFSCMSQDIAVLAKKYKKLFFLVMDDDLLNLPLDYPVLPCRIESLRSILNNTDLIMTTNKLIGDKFIKIGKCNYYVLFDTVIDLKDMRLVRRLDSKINILYAASKRHSVFFDTFVCPALLDANFVNKWKGKIKFTFIGVNPQTSDLREFYEVINLPMMNFDDYRKYILKTGFDIGIAPIENDIFYYCKYYNKFLEYSLAGILGVYTNCKPYNDIVKDSENGFLAPNSIEGWQNAIENAIYNVENGNSCLKNAQELLKEKFTKDVIAKSLYDSIPFLSSYKSPKIKSKISVFIRIKYYFFRLKEYFFFIRLYLKNEGLIKTIFRSIRYIIDVAEYNKK